MKIAHTYITKQEQLNKLVAAVLQRKIVALDTEFTRQNTYYPILSIIQVALKNPQNLLEVFIIDSLENLDLTAFLALFSNSEITKIFHSSEQDLQIIYQKSNSVPQGIFDTQLAANFCGFGCGVGYSNLVEKIFGVVIDKKQQRSDWQRRPLSSKQIEYAISDVIFLEEIYEKFLAILRELNFEKYYAEEVASFVQNGLFRSEDVLIKNFTPRNKSQVQLARIKHLIAWREKFAREFDVPRRHFLEDEMLEKLAALDFENVSLSKKFGAEILPKIKNELEKISDGDDSILPRESMTAEQKEIFQKAKNAIMKIGVATKFSEQFLLTNSNLRKIILDKNSFDKIIAGWRRELFGNELQKLIY